MDPSGSTDIRDQCAKAGVAFFFKQWGGKNKKKAGRVLEGKTYDAMPETAPTVPVARVSRLPDAPWPSWADHPLGAAASGARWPSRWSSEVDTPA
jgi:hypothetical protein